MENDQVETLKGGHAPAQKVGGVRIVAKPAAPTKEVSPDPPSKTTENPEASGDDDKDKKSVKPSSGGAVAEVATHAELEAAFPKAAVKAYHDKPIPKHQKDVAPKRPEMNIQQPKK